MSDAKLTYDVDLSTWRAFYTGAKVAADTSLLSKMEGAATRTMKDAADLLKAQGRADIKRGGLSARFANAWRVSVYPKRGASLDPTAYGKHKIPYALIFETGGTIKAKHGLLWLPLPTVPKVGKRIARPKDLKGVKLFSFQSAGGTPILAAKIRNAGVNRDSRIRGQVSLPALRAGTNAEKIRTTSRLRGKNRGGVKASNAGANIVTVPLFHGVPSVTLRRRFDLKSVATRVTAQLPALYERHAPKD